MDYIEENLDEIDPMKMKALENIAERLQSSMAVRASGIGSLERNPKKYKSIVFDNILYTDKWKPF